MAGGREPHLRKNVRLERVQLCRYGAGEEDAMQMALEDFRARLRTLSRREGVS
jgi:hypothetical protein